MDDNNTSEELPLDGGGGDIEQGGSAIIPEDTDSVWSSEAAAITPPPSKWTLGELEEVDVVEDAAPVPLIQHIAGMGIDRIEKDDIRASDSASLPRPPTQDVRPTVMEDDSQRPKPSEYDTFESNADDEFNRRLLAKAAIAADLKGETKRPTVMEDDSSRPTPSSDSAVFESNADDEFHRRLLAKAAVAAASNGEDTMPPVADDDSQSRRFDSTYFADEGSKKITAAPQPPIQHAMKQIEDGDDAAPRPFNSAELVSSSSNGQTEAAGGAGASCTDDNGSIGEDPVVHQMNEHPSPGDEENNLQRLVGSFDIHSTSDNEKTRQVVPSAAETETETHPSLPILEAYLVEEEEGRDTPGGQNAVYEATPVEPELPWWKQRRTKVFMMIICILMIAMAVGLGAAFSRSIPIAEADNSNDNNTAKSYKCFSNRNELKPVVDRYVEDGCGKAAILCTDISNMYGWPIGSWCVGNITDMSSLFEGLDTFDEDISGWRVDRVTDMSRMFADAGMFKQDISSWNMSSVTSTREMFKGATSFNQNVCAWKDTFPYSNTNDMFVDSGCTYSVDPSSSFQGPFCASTCNTVTAADCFTTRDELKAAVDQYVQGDWDIADSVKYGWTIGSWCVGNVTDMSELFKDLSEFNEDISQWEVGQVTDMSHMFRRASSFNQEDLSNWDTSAVTTMEAMFSEASAFDGNISSWNTSAVTTMRSIFYGASSFAQEDLSRWDTSAVTTMYAMFDSALAFNGNISSWNTSAVTDMSYMFWRASSFNQEYLSNWDTSAVTNMEAMFVGASAFNGNISSWNTSAVTAMNHMFWRASSFNQEGLSKWDTSAVTTMRSMFIKASAFNGNISSWNTSSVTDMSHMFKEASSFNQDGLSKWDTSAVTAMKAMFFEASSFNGNISSWNTSAVTTMVAMFYGAASFNQNLCSWKDNFPYDNANDIFLGSGCTFLGEPQVVQQGQGPFCAASCANND